MSPVGENAILDAVQRPFRTAPRKLLLQIFSIGKHFFLPAILLLGLNACAMEGDFGRPRPTVFSRIADESILNLNIATRGIEWPRMTRDETILRESGHRLTRPFERPVAASKISYEAPSYARAHPWEQHGPGPLLVIDRSIAEDHHALSEFAESARKVLSHDGQRLDMYMKRDPGMSARRMANARERLEENMAYIDSVFVDFNRKLNAYHYAIEEVRLHEPDIVVVETQGSLDHLRDRSAALRHELNNFYGVAMARANAMPVREEGLLDRLRERRAHMADRRLPPPEPMPVDPEGPPLKIFK